MTTPTKGVTALLRSITERFGEGSLMKLGSRESLNVEAIPTGALTLDMALGIGGVPRGRITEIYGVESAGKTTLLYHIIANAQSQGGICAFIDAEHAIDPAYAKAIGVDIDELLISQPDYGEQALEIADQLIKSGEVAVVAIDSVDALVPRAVLNGEMGEATVGLHARLMSQALRKFAPAVNRSNTAVVFTNQLRANINTTFPGAPKETQPGGRALKFYASARLDMRRIQTLKQGDEATGNRVRVKVVKNKCAAPFKTAEFDIDYGLGVSHEGCLIDLGLEKGLVKKSGSHFSLNGHPKKNGRPATKAFLRENKEAAAELEEAIRNG